MFASNYTMLRMMDTAAAVETLPGIPTADHFNRSA